ncbi:MAG: type II secretion system protein [Candidatus Doudnabacteria bacterium]|nr:type II secretion system protein [Candidatus Doudnabacteria bacterium]
MLNLKKSLIQKDSSEFGQTLIETIIAIFILVSGIAAAVGLAIFALSKSQNITKQMVAVGLAREGVEAIKNMRDTNWLKQTVINTNCYNRVTGANDAKCYQNWQDEVFDIEPTSGNPATKNVILLLDHNPGDYWVLCDKTKYGLAFDSNISNANFEGYYTLAQTNFDA